MSLQLLSPLSTGRRRTARGALAILLATGLAGCVTVPPPNDAIALAQNQLQAARDAHAADYAPVDLDFAKGQLDQAQAAMAAQHYAAAADLASESQADGRLAMIRGQLGALRAEIKSLTAENATLRQQLLQSGEHAAAKPVQPGPPASGQLELGAPEPGDAPKSWPTPLTKPGATSPPTDRTELPEQVLPSPDAPASSASAGALDDVDGGVQ